MRCYTELHGAFHGGTQRDISILCSLRIFVSAQWLSVSRLEWPEVLRSRKLITVWTRMKRNIDEQRAVIAITRVTGILLVVGCLSLLVDSQGGPGWVGLVGGLAFAAILLAPPSLLVVNAGLAVAWMNALWHMVAWRPAQRRFHSTGSGRGEWKRWHELAYGERVAVCLIALGCLVFGLLVARYALVEAFSTLVTE
jgi:hypothetical protein